MEFSPGSRTLRVMDGPDRSPFPVWVLYPTTTRARPLGFGPYTLTVAAEAPLAAGSFPLVVLSHGSGSSPLVNRDLGLHLATHGFVVAMPEHPGNNRNDNRLAGTLQNLIDRPHHLRLTIDAIARSAPFERHVPCDSVAVIGHSLGGYTALALAGGEPWTREGERVPTVVDSRIKALVLLAPAVGWYRAPGALRHVTTPILAWAAGGDTLTPSAEIQAALSDLSARGQVTLKIAANGGHFSFLSPFPPEMQRADFPPSVDPAGFDRPHFHQELNATVLDFLRQQLTAPA